MDKKKTLKKRVWRLEDMPIIKIKKDVSIRPFDPLEILLSKEKMGLALLECLEKDDDEALLDIAKTYIAMKKKHGPKKEKAKPAKATVKPLSKIKKKPIIPAKSKYPAGIEKRAQKKTK